MDKYNQLLLSCHDLLINQCYKCDYYCNDGTCDNDGEALELVKLIEKELMLTNV